MGEPLTRKQMKDSLDRWGCWVHIDAVVRLDKYIAESEQALIQAKRDYIPTHFAICRQHHVNPFKLLRDPDEIYFEWVDQISRMRTERDKTSRFLDSIETGVRTLSEKQQEILRAQYVEFKDLNTISTQMGIPKSAVYAQHANAVNKMRMMFTLA